MNDFTVRIGDSLNIKRSGYMERATVTDMRAYIADDSLGVNVTVVIDGDTKNVPIFLLRTWVERAKE